MRLVPTAPASLDLDVGQLDEVGPFLEVRSHQGLEFGTGHRRRIERHAEDSLARARDVANATREQAIAATGIAGHVENIASMTEETDAATRNNAAAAQELKNVAASLQAAVAYFKV